MGTMEINYDAVAELLTLGFVWGDNTIEGKKVNRTLVVPEFETYKGATVLDVEEALKNSIERVVKGKDQIGVHLSGGKDTRLIAALARSLGIEITGITFSDPGDVDEIIARKVAKCLGIPHKICTVTTDNYSPEVMSEIVQDTDGLISFQSLLFEHIFNKKLANDFDVVLSWRLMSEIMDTWDFKKYPKNPLEAMKKRLGYLPIIKEEYVDTIEKKLNDLYKEKSLEEIMLDTIVKNVYLRHIEATRKYVNIFPVVIDREVLSSIYSLPLEKRRNCYLAKKIIKRNNPKLLCIPYSYSGYMIPLAFPYIIHQGLRLIHTRGKKKFFGQSDVAYHIRYTLKNFVESKINALNIDLINRDMVNKLLKEHLSGKQYHTDAICRLVTLRIWLENTMRE